MKRARFQHITADTRLRSRWSLPQIALRNLGHLQNITPHIPHLQCQTANHSQEDIHAQKPDIASGIYNSKLPNGVPKPRLGCGGTGYRRST